MITLRLKIESDLYSPVSGSQDREFKSTSIEEEEFLKSIFLLPGKYPSLSTEQIDMIIKLTK